ncbi:PEP-CTERM domain protein [Oopsacas minuta]|uniref:PEP-CTERM domain protein n=1 Tax=Oopsacas minuta TaxID=111878 RepID=A0AAV7KET2_9METZ|nr:PEP-CTERM domain protein [Oopsacas minuta]
MLNKHSEPIITLGHQCKSPGKLFKPHGIAINEQNTLLYVAEGIGVSRISTFTCEGDFVTCFTDKRMLSSTWGIAVIKDNIYVTDMDEDLLINFQQEGLLCRVTVVGGYGSGDDEFKGPNQLAVSNKGDIYVADVWNNRIKVLDSNLIFLYSIIHALLTFPVDVQLLPNELYVLSCEDSPCVHVFSYKGEMLRSMITQGDGMQVHGASFFCLDSANNIFISDWGCHQVKIFSDRALVQVIGEEGHEKGMFWYPYGATITIDSIIIIVSLNRNYTLQIFDVQI